MSMIAGYSLHFGLSNAARKSLIKLLQVCADPTFHTLNVWMSDYYFNTTYDPPDNKINFHYCTNCYCEIFRTTKKQFQRTKTLCEFCSTEYNITLSCDNFFLTLKLIEDIIKKISNRIAFESWWCFFSNNTKFNV